MTATFAIFDTIRVINLPERSDRRVEMEQELAKLGLSEDHRVAFFPAIRPQDAGPFTSIGARGVYESQKAILNEAASNNRSVLILEDDCAFTEAARAFSFEHGWDVYYGGYYAANPDALDDSDIVGAHMMGFSAFGAKLAAAYLNSLAPYGIHPPIDAAYIWWRRANPEIRTFFAVPQLAHQRLSRSDIAPAKLHDRLPIVRRMVAILRTLRNKKGRH